MWFIRRKPQGRIHRLYFFLWEGPEWLGHMADREGYLYHCETKFWNRWYNRWDWISRPMLWILCKLLGHQPVDDQCRKPEHRSCVWCNANQAYKQVID